MITITGKCACGSITYKASGELLRGTTCFCSTCQRISGGGPNHSLVLIEYTLESTGGPRIYAHPGGSGAIIEKSFCGACGSHLFAQGGLNSHSLRIKVGSLDDQNVYKPTLQTWTSEAKPWHRVDPELTSFEENPTGRADT